MPRDADKAPSAAQLRAGRVGLSYAMLYDGGVNLDCKKSRSISIEPECRKFNMGSSRPSLVIPYSAKMDPIQTKLCRDAGNSRFTKFNAGKLAPAHDILYVNKVELNYRNPLKSKVDLTLK